MSVNVAIVEDDPAVRGIFADWIDKSSKFHCVAQHGNAASALAAIPTQSPDVVLMDINLPDMLGTECVRQLKPQMPRTQFVMVTVYGDNQHIFDALAAGATGYLLKQTPPAELIAAIKEVHAGGSPMSSHIARKIVQSFQHAAPAAGAQALTPREAEVLDLLAKGFLYKEIADSMLLSYATVHTHIRHIYEKLQVRSRTEAVAKHLNQGFARREAVAP